MLGSGTFDSSEFKDLFGEALRFLGAKLIPKWDVLLGWGCAVFYSVPRFMEIFLRLVGDVVQFNLFDDQLILTRSLWVWGRLL